MCFLPATTGAAARHEWRIQFSSVKTKITKSIMRLVVPPPPRISPVLLLLLPLLLLPLLLLPLVLLLWPLHLLEVLLLLLSCVSAPAVSPGVAASAPTTAPAAPCTDFSPAPSTSALLPIILFPYSCSLCYSLSFYFTFSSSQNSTS